MLKVNYPHNLVAGEGLSSVVNMVQHVKEVGDFIATQAE